MLNNVLVLNAQKLGVNDAGVLQKSEEFIRILQTKSTVNGIHDVAKSIICLDLATSHVGVIFDKKNALKLCGLRSTVYNRYLHTVETLLDVNRLKTVSDLCVQFQCVDVSELATDILEKYSKDKDEKCQHPQYLTAAIYTASKLNKITVDKAALSTASHLKRSQWEKLTKDFEVFANKAGFQTLKKQTQSRYKSAVVKDKLNDVSDEGTFINEESSEEEEDYEVWKERILKAARKATVISVKQ